MGQHLRVRAFLHKTVRVAAPGCHVYCNFKIGFTCRITVIFGTLKMEVFWLINQTFVLATEHVPKWCRAKNIDAFLSKSFKFHLFGLSYYVQILLFGAQTLIKELQMTFQTSDVSICNGNEIPYRNINFSHLILRSSSFMFPLLLITVEVKNTICNSLITMLTTSWRNLIKIGWSEPYKILSFFTKNRFKC